LGLGYAYDKLFGGSGSGWNYANSNNRETLGPYGIDSYGMQGDESGFYSPSGRTGDVDSGYWDSGNPASGTGPADGPGSGGGTGEGNGGADEMHTGGIVGMGYYPKRYVNPAIFAAAPRLHGGLRYDEYPAILQSGEVVRSRKQVAESNRPIEIPIYIDSREVGRAVINNPANIRDLKASTGNYGRVI
jgi:hypothetical protein